MYLVITNFYLELSKYPSQFFVLELSSPNTGITSNIL
jgi:hypothetical protein